MKLKLSQLRRIIKEVTYSKNDSNKKSVSADLRMAATLISRSQAQFEESDPAWSDLEKAWTLVDAVESDLVSGSSEDDKSFKPSETDNHIFDEFERTLLDLDINPAEDDYESQVTDFAVARGYDPEMFYGAFREWFEVQ